MKKVNRRRNEVAIKKKRSRRNERKRIHITRIKNKQARVIFKII
jgi:hypothetical protein